MDLSFNVVASKCREQMAKYQQCVMKNQDGDWGNICRAEAIAVTKCADESVPHLAELKKACATQIWEYRSCLEANGAESDDVIREKCGDKLKALWECTEAKVAEFDKK